ncbi:MAG: hypothetical protein ABIA37_05065 [Candidatus Woesearchaeota archaeon]
MIVIRTQIKEIVKECGINNISEDFTDKLDAKVKLTIQESCRRAKENSRKTVMGKDI